MFKHIFVPTDGSELSRATAQRAVSFAKEAGARITAFFAKPEYPTAYFGEGALLDPFLSAGPDEVDQWLAEAPEQESDKAGFRLEIIPVTSADPDDLTLRATRLLGQADMVFHTADIAPAILHRARADARRSYSAQAPHWSGPGLALWLCGKQEEQA